MVVPILGLWPVRKAKRFPHGTRLNADVQREGRWFDCHHALGKSPRSSSTSGCALKLFCVRLWVKEAWHLNRAELKPKAKVYASKLLGVQELCVVLGGDSLGPDWPSHRPAARVVGAYAQAAGGTEIFERLR